MAYPPLPATAPRPSLRRGGIAAALTVASLLTAGCSSTPASDKIDTFACPKIGILRDANRVTLYRPGGGHGPADILGRVQIADYSGTCTVEDSRVAVDLRLIMLGERGPAFGAATQIPFRYFVAVVGPDGRVMNRQAFTTGIDFQPGMPRAGTVEDVQPRIPLHGAQTAADFQVLVGVELTREQLTDNRRDLKK